MCVLNKLTTVETLGTPFNSLLIMVVTPGEVKEMLSDDRKLHINQPVSSFRFSFKKTVEDETVFSRRCLCA